MIKNAQFSGRFWLTCILLAAFAAKAPFLSAPLTGYFGSYQAVNGMMAVMMQQGGWYSYLIPRTFLLIGGEPSLHLLYYPFGSLIAASFNIWTGIPIDFWGRIQAAVFTLGAGWILYELAVKWFDKNTALLSAFLFSFFPMVLIEGISFQNEAVAMFLLLLAMYCSVRAENAIGALGAGLLFSVCLGARIHCIFLFPAFFLLYMTKNKRWGMTASFCLGSAVMMGLWVAFLFQLSQEFGGHIQTSLFGQAQDGRILLHPLVFTPGFYKRILEILTQEWTTPFLLAPVILGVGLASSKARILAVWLAGSLFTAVVLPQKVHDHPFYFLYGLPAAALIGGAFLQRLSASGHRKQILILLFFFLIGSFRQYLPSALSAYQAPPIVEFGNYVRENLPQNSRVIAQHGSSPDLLYYTWRKGWPFYLQRNDEVLIAALEKFHKEGADYLLISEPKAFYEKKGFSSYVLEHYRRQDAIPGEFIIFFLNGELQ